ncbi:MAG: VTT domain-containing protein, partial [Bdellovibrionaceae bacterium]|nr:VTT domain-containing protein [Pseudobdellovibrionaceae bacterium]
MLNTYFISLFLGTFAIEDATLLAAIALVATHQISFFSAFMACFLGIAIGDFVLYFFGLLASKVPAVSNGKFFRRLHEKFNASGEKKFLTYAVIASRFIPGTRLPTYTIAGFLRFSFGQFIIINIVTVFVWVYMAFTVGAFIGRIFAEHWFLTIVWVFLVMSLFRYLYINLETAWKRKIFRHKWRKWLQF